MPERPTRQGGAPFVNNLPQSVLDRYDAERSKEHPVSHLRSVPVEPTLRAHALFLGAPSAWLRGQTEEDLRAWVDIYERQQAESQRRRNLRHLRVARGDPAESASGGADDPG